MVTFRNVFTQSNFLYLCQFFVSIRVLLIFIDKRPYTDAHRYLMLGRNPNLESESPPTSSLFGVLPPFAPCVQSANRTPVRSEGWRL
jgi:hypothetical protein